MAFIVSACLTPSISCQGMPLSDSGFNASMLLRAVSKWLDQAAVATRNKLGAVFRITRPALLWRIWDEAVGYPVPCGGSVLQTRKRCSFHSMSTRPMATQHLLSIQHAYYLS